MNKKYTFLDTPEWDSIVKNIKGIMISDGSMSTLLDFERVLDEADIYAFKNWKLGELVDGPKVSKYTVTAIFMWPEDLMPDPRGAKRLLPLGCKIEFKNTKIKFPVSVESPNDYANGTHYPKMVDRSVWLVRISMPKNILDDIREGSVDIAEQTVELEDLDDAYQKDYDTADTVDDDQQQNQQQDMMGQSLSMPGMPTGI